MDEMQVAQQLGAVLKQQRRARHLTQAQLAAGICTQSLISSLEAGRYLPNVVLFAQLCERLDLPMQQALLADYPTITTTHQITETVVKLCNQHAYADLLAYLNHLEPQLPESADLASFYYYRGVARFQSGQLPADAVSDLQLALSYPHLTAAVKLLIVNALGFYYMQSGQVKLGRAYFDQALALIAAAPTFMANQSAVAYQQALCAWQQQQFHQAITQLQTAIAVATDHDSHYMLGDLLVLLAACYDQVHDEAAAEHCRQQGQTLAQLFKTPLYQFSAE